MTVAIPDPLADVPLAAAPVSPVPVPAVPGTRPGACPVCGLVLDDSDPAGRPDVDAHQAVHARAEGGT